MAEGGHVAPAYGRHHVAHDSDIQMIDSTSVRVHQQAATAKRGVQITVSVALGA
jgi:hypothetical protein